VRQGPNGNTSQGEKGKSPPAKEGNIKEDESREEHEMDLVPLTHAQSVTGTKCHARRRVYVKIFFIEENTPHFAKPTIVRPFLTSS
jgi:hypothetical protein